MSIEDEDTMSAKQWLADNHTAVYCALMDRQDRLEEKVKAGKSPGYWTDRLEATQSAISQLSEVEL